jgi:CRP-like cAMP-binding protein
MWILSLLKPDSPRPQDGVNAMRISGTYLAPRQEEASMIFFELFSNAPEIITIPAGQPLFREGEQGRTMHVLIRGAAEITIGSHLLEVLLPGHIVGEMSVVSPGPRSATVTATEDCEFVAIDEHRFNELVRQAPDFALKVMRTLTERLRRTDASVRPGAQVSTVAHS